MSNIETKKEEILQRALYYESQYRNAILSNAVSFYDVNLTKDLIETDIIFKTANDEVKSSLELVNLSAPCSFSLFINTWVKCMVTPANLANYPFVENLRQILLDTYHEGKRAYELDYWIKTKDGRELYLNQLFLLTHNEYGDICALSIVKDHTETKQQEVDSHKKELKQYAYYDPVTHGYNYIKFKSKLQEHKEPGWIIAFDIHSFKIINSICGILRGDAVIKTIWEVLTRVLKFDDGYLAGHINADHFIIFLPECPVDKIIQKIENITTDLSNSSTKLSVPQLLPYYGVSHWEPGKKIELAYSESVAAKHNAKTCKKQNYDFFDESDAQKLIVEKEIIDNFEDALAKKEFKLWYQPKFNPVNKKLVGAEALVRWQKDEENIIPPALFIPVFEKQGIIRKFDEYIFRNVCLQQKKWFEQGLEIVPVSINLSRISLYYNNIVTEYSKITDEVGLSKEFLPIEITESAAVTNNEIKGIADSFYKAGFKLQMDDFGSGYSSLASINTMHFDTLKLDKSLIDYIGNFGGDRLLEHTILLAKELGMHVTAEGVENDNQVAFLKHIGCDSIQGYFYSKPIPVEQFEKLLSSKGQYQLSTSDDFIINHIMKFKSSMIKPPLYSFLVNLTKNEYCELSGSLDFFEETKVMEKDFDKATRFLAETLILPEYQSKYLEFINSRNIIKNYQGHPETKVLEYKRLYNGEIVDIRLLAHIFKVDETKEIQMYETVSII